MSRVEELCTANVDPRDRVDYWNRTMSEAFTPLECTPARRSDFTARARRVSLGELSITETHADPQIIRRTDRHIASSPAALFFLHQQIAGGSVMYQDGRVARLNPGDLTLSDTTRPYEQQIGAGSHRLIVGIPATLMRRHLARPDQLAGRRISGERGPGVLLSQFLPRLWEAVALAGEESKAHQHLSQAFMHLLASAVNGTSSGAERAGTAQAQRISLKQFIDLHLCDPALSPRTVADAGRITTRYLHYLFQGEEESVAQYILRRRLEECSAALRDPAQRRRSITAISSDFGFRSETQFGRAFRRAFGVTPRTHRNTGA
jgi:AraC-like DNA-binding protein